MAITKKHKAFRWVTAMPIDANNIILEQAFARFLVLVRTKGRPITSTTKSELHPEDLVDLVNGDPAHFQGVDGDQQRQRLLQTWLATDFATCISVGHAGEARIANLKPIHMSTIKLLDPRIRSQDRDLSGFLYNVFRDSDLVIGEGSLLLPFLTKGTNPFGDHDLKLNEREAGKLDVETLFLLRLLENFKTDLPDNRKRIAPHVFLCPAQQQLIVNDTARLLVYKDIIPRRELVQYLISLFSFHAALYALRTFSIVSRIVETKKFRCTKCKGITPGDLKPLSACEHHPDIFVDLTNGQSKTAEELAKQRVAKHYGQMFRYFRAHYKLKKLDEFASTFPGYTGAIEELVSFMNHKDLNGYFRTKLTEVTQTEEGADPDPEIQGILDLKLDPLDTYVEILYQKTFRSRSNNHKRFMASVCGLNREDGFLHGGRGKRRKYVLGNQLLELLVQLAVVGVKGGRFTTQPIPITDFVTWLRERYGILIDTTGEPNDSPEVSRALETNYSALKDRLRQLGFFTDLSDASISQVIKPRFPIYAERP
ncbi:MAG: hypothetical protein M3P26_07895 [Gemmatimonadota bacterium]|nr:hypothetical protein [Gemmatimonadota bacterium]